MRTIVHLSDLHFGRTDPTILQPLIDHVRTIGPDVVVVSGDLTQRARRHEFQDAKKFLDALPQPQIVVPGNHDVPLYDVFSRFVQPLAKYRRYISADVEPTYMDDEIAVIGVNTARSLTFKSGRVNAEQIARIRKTLCAMDERVIKVIVTHHPFDLPSDHGEEQLVGRAKLAMPTLADCRADLLLAGHLHTSHAGNTYARYPIQDYAALVVQAGTATSVRGRGETNSFNLIRIEPSKITIERHGWIAESTLFSVVKTEHFEAIGSAMGGTKLRWLNVPDTP
jgi:3',5'-cyclic AMP phosphodiesterase CpdA